MRRQKPEGSAGSLKLDATTARRFAPNYSASDISCPNFGLQAKRRSLVSKAILVLFIHLTVTHIPSRKDFFANQLGVVIAASGRARLFGNLFSNSQEHSGHRGFPLRIERCRALRLVAREQA